MRQQFYRMQALAEAKTSQALGSKDYILSNPDLVRAHTYTVVIPVYNSEKSVSSVIQRAAAVFEEQGLEYEIIAVDDGSLDGSLHKLVDCAKANRKVKVVSLLKNYGQQSAILCGLSYAKGDYVINLDDDLQNPPEELVKLIDKAVEGYDLVCGVYTHKKAPIYRQLGSRLINKINESIFNKPKDFRLTNYRVMERGLASRVCEYKTAFPYINGLSMLLSGQRANVEVRHEARAEGKSTYTIGKILSLVAAILLNYSSVPLQIMTYFGLFVSAMSFLGGLYVCGRELMGSSKVPGWTSLVVLLSFYNGVLILMLGLVGEYTMRILNTIAVPRSYNVREVFGQHDS